MDLEKQVDMVVNKICDIMYKHDNLFPIASVLKEYAEKNLKLASDEDKETYVKLTIQTRIGLRSVVREKLNGLGGIWFIIDKNNIEDLKISIAKSAILEYVSPYQDRIHNFNSIKNEEFCW